jgi:hypothetical protein
MTRDERAQLDMFPDSPEANRIAAAEATTLRARIATILRTTAIHIAQCRACGQTIFFVPRRKRDGETKQTIIPFQEDGRSHFKACPKASDFGRHAKVAE